VRTALDGDGFVGNVTSYLDDRTLAASRPIDVDGLQWVVIAEQATQETARSLDRFVKSILVVLAILLPAIAIVGVAIGRSLVRPVRPLVAAASRIAGGDFDPDLPDLGSNELGDLAQQLHGVAQQLRTRHRDLAAEEQRIEEMLRAILPPRLIERVRDGERGIVDVVDTATVVSVMLIGLPDPSDPDQDATLEASSRIVTDLDLLAGENELERVHISADHQLFLAGLGRPGPEVEPAIGFAALVGDVVAAAGQELGVSLDVRVGLSAGDIATGVLGSQQLSFGVWGDPPRVAATLGAIARRGQVLVNASVADVLDANWHVDPIDGGMGLNDESIEAFSVVRAASPID